MKVQNILISQPVPKNSSPYSDIITKFGVHIDFFPFFHMEPLTGREFRNQKLTILDYTAIVFTAKSTIDAFFKICSELRVSIPETMKYFCSQESVALYLQKYIVYRKRKIFFGTGRSDSIIKAIGSKHKSEKFLLATSDNVNPSFFKIFDKAKLNYSNGTFTKTVKNDLQEVDIDKYDMLVFYSPSDAKSLLENYPDFASKGIKIATFGNLTAKAVEDAGLQVEIKAPTPKAPSIANALNLYLDE